MATVLVVDDMESSRRVVAKLLSAEGHTPVCARNGLEALSMLQHVSPDIILLDILMPVMDGLTFLEILRQSPQWEALPVILMTGITDDKSMKKAQQLGAKEYLVKASFTGRDMLAQIDRYVSRH